MEKVKSVTYRSRNPSGEYSRYVVRTEGRRTYYVEQYGVDVIEDHPNGQQTKSLIPWHLVDGVQYY